MNERNVTEVGVEKVLANPTKVVPANEGCWNVFGYDENGFRQRVTLDPTKTFVVTVANADWRLKK
jgi:hypothetical protein